MLMEGAAGLGPGWGRGLITYEMGTGPRVKAAWWHARRRPRRELQSQRRGTRGRHTHRRHRSGRDRHGQGGMRGEECAAMVGLCVAWVIVWPLEVLKNRR